MSPEEAAKIIVHMVPQWYFADHGPNEYDLKVNETPLSFKSIRPLTPDLSRFRDSAQTLATAFLDDSTANLPCSADVLREMLAVSWLEQVSRKVNWKKMLSYVGTLSDRTYENAPVTVNMIVRPGDAGVQMLDNGAYGKFTDHLASSPFTYFLVDGELKMVDYCEIEWKKINSTNSYKFYPEFLVPFQSIMQEGDYSIHLTRQRDVIVTRKAGDKSGLLAARRKRQWKIYDVQTFKNAVVGAMCDYAVGATIFEVLFDLSFRRHGALLVYDPDNKVIMQVANPECRIDLTSPTAGRELVATAAKRIKLTCGVSSPVINKRLLLELAGIDGAVVFNDSGITAIGAIIKNHDEATGQTGARSTAAMSAFLHGGKPANVSADGEICLIFKSVGTNGDCQASMEWL